MTLAEKMRAAGLRVIEYPGYVDRGSGVLVVKGATMHHTGSNRNSGNLPALGICVNGRKGVKPVPGPLCNALVGRDGTWALIAMRRANHAGTGSSKVAAEMRDGYVPPQSAQARHLPDDTSVMNAQAFGVEVENDGVGEPYTPLQMDALARGMAVVKDFYHFAVTTIIGHLTYTSRKIDPTYPIDLFRWLVANVPTEDDDPMTPAQEAVQAAILKNTNDILRIFDTIIRPKLDDVWSEVVDENHGPGDPLGPRFITLGGRVRALTAATPLPEQDVPVLEPKVTA